VKIMDRRPDFKKMFLMDELEKSKIFIMDNDVKINYPLNDDEVHGLVKDGLYKISLNSSDKFNKFKGKIIWDDIYE
jgi:hypothetical protein